MAKGDAPVPAHRVDWSEGHVLHRNASRRLRVHLLFATSNASFRYAQTDLVKLRTSTTLLGNCSGYKCLVERALHGH